MYWISRSEILLIYSSGIKISINQVDSYNQFNLGREVYIKLQGLFIGETNSGDGVIAIGGGSNQFGDEISEISEIVKIGSSWSGRHFRKRR